MSTATKNKPTTRVTHAKAMATETKNWIGLPQECVACGLVKIIGDGFGLRKMKPHLPPVPQSWCNACRREERIIRSNNKELSTDDVKELTRKYHGQSGYIKPVVDEEKQAAKQAKEAAKEQKRKERESAKKSKVTKRGNNVITTSREDLAILFDIHCPAGFHGKKGAALAWKIMFRKLREVLGANMVLDKSVLEFPAYLEVLEADNNEF